MAAICSASVEMVTEGEWGAGLRVMAEGLTADGVPTARGGQSWSTSTVQAVLTGQDAALLRNIRPAAPAR